MSSPPAQEESTKRNNLTGKVTRTFVNHNLDCLIFQKRERKTIQDNVQRQKLEQQQRMNQTRKLKKIQKEQKNLRKQEEKNEIQSKPRLQVEPIMIKAIPQKKIMVQNVQKNQALQKKVEPNNLIQSRVETKHQEIKLGRQKKHQARKKLLKLQDNSQSSSEMDKNWRQKRKSIKFVNKEKRYELNKIFRKENQNQLLKEYPAVTLDVDFKHFSFSKFVELFGQFQMILVSKTVKDVLFLDLNLISKNGFIFIWATKRQINLGYHVLNKWGYEIIDQIIWIKTKNQQQIILEQSDLFYNSIQLCLVGYKCSSNEHIQYKTKVSNNIIFAPLTEGKKPSQIYQIMELIMPGGKKIEIFGQGKSGWFALKQIQEQTQTEQLKPTVYLDKFYVSCDICKIPEISGIAFECKSCKNLNICQSCFFKSLNPQNRQILQELGHRQDHKLSLKRDKQQKGKIIKCFCCQSLMNINSKCYICENCYNIYICLECHKTNRKPNKPNHSHNDQHFLTLLI